MRARAAWWTLAVLLTTGVAFGQKVPSARPAAEGPAKPVGTAKPASSATAKPAPSGTAKPITPGRPITTAPPKPIGGEQLKPGLAGPSSGQPIQGGGTSGSGQPISGGGAGKPNPCQSSTAGPRAGASPGQPVAGSTQRPTSQTASPAPGRQQAPAMRSQTDTAKTSAQSSSQQGNKPTMAGNPVQSGRPEAAGNAQIGQTRAEPTPCVEDPKQPQPLPRPVQQPKQPPQDAPKGAGQTQTKKPASLPQQQSADPKAPRK